MKYLWLLFPLLICSCSETKEQCQTYPTEMAALMSLCLDKSYGFLDWNERWADCVKKTGFQPVKEQK